MTMASGSGFNHRNNDFVARGFLTPPPTWKTNRYSPVMPRSENLPRRSSSDNDTFHVIHKVPYGDSPYVRAKHVQLIDKDPSRAISMFWAAINLGDRVDSALKDMAIVMKQLNRSDEAVEAIKSFRHLCPNESQESLDNILIELYKQSGRIEEEIELLQLKLKQVEEGMAFGGKRIKKAKSQGKKVQITVEKEYSRLLGNLAWAYMQKNDFKLAEEHYRKALSVESDKNKQCNLAICLMHMNKLSEAKFLLQAIKPCDNNNKADMDELHHAKSYERAAQMLSELESQCILKPIKQNKLSPLPLSVKKTGIIPYEKRADFDWRKNLRQLNMNQEESYESPLLGNRYISKVPFTHESSCPRVLPFGSSTADSSSSDDYNSDPYELIGRIHRGPSYAKCEESLNLLKEKLDTSARERKKSWTDVVGEESLYGFQSQYEKSFSSSMNEEEWFGDENADSNIISDEKLRQQIELIDLGSGYLSQPETLSVNKSARRSLRFDGFDKQEEDYCYSCTESVSRGRKNRLQVFKDITSTL